MAAPQASSRLEMLQEMPIRSQQLGARGVSMGAQTWAVQEPGSTFTNLKTMARFQQKQLQEKEQKLLQLYDQQQQRAYQVVQRGSAGSNHGSTIRTTTTTHTTSTSQGGKVRQMFDERRQTTVKGIDRSYPLEPLENKLRKQITNTNGLTTQRNGNLTTVNRQSVNVRRVARADVNSNVNGGKPVVSYREEVTRESFGPSVHRHDDEDEFGSENRIVNGHHRHDLDNEEETLDQETVERNRMMAKIHLMGFDDSLKHRVRNDLESEEFPEYLMVDVPDKLPKRSVTKKLSQAEARLERFKNANAKRSNNNAPKQSTASGAATKRRTEQMLPARSNSRGSEIAANGTSSGSVRSGSSRTWERSRGNPDNTENPSLKIRDRPYVADGVMGKTRKESPDVETLRRCDNPRSSLGQVGTTEATWRSHSLDNYYKSLSSDGKIILRHGVSPRFRESVSFRSASADRDTRETSRSTSSEYSRREGEGSALLIDRRGSASSYDREILAQQDERVGETATNIDRKYAEITRSRSPQFFRKKLGQSAATVSLDRKNMDFRSASADRRTSETAASRSTEYFGREGDRSTMTMMINERARRPTVSSRNREILTKLNKRTKGATTSVDRKYAEITRDKRSSSSSSFLRDSGKSDATINVDRKDIKYRSASADRQTHETSRNTSPEFFCKEGERSATTMMIDRRGSTSARDQEILMQQRKQTREATASIDRKYTKIAREKRSSSSPFFLRNSGKSDATMSVGRTGVGLRSISTDRQTRETRTSRSTSPEFFYKEDERSATTMMINRRGSTSARDQEITQQRKQTRGATASIDRKYTKIAREKRSSSSPFFPRNSGKSDATMSVGQAGIGLRSISADRQIREARINRSTRPEFFCKEGEKSAMMIDRRGSMSSRDRETLIKQSKRAERTSISMDRKYTTSTREKHSSSPSFFLKDSGKSDATMSVDRTGVGLRSISADRQIREARTSRSTSPEFFSKKDEKSATTMMIDRRGSTSSYDRELLTKQSKQTEGTSTSMDRKYTTFTREKRSSSPSFFLRDSGKSDATMSVDRKNINHRSATAGRQTREIRTTRRPKLATTTMIDRKESISSRDREILTKQSRRAKGTPMSIGRKYTVVTRDRFSSSPQFFSKKSERSASTRLMEPKSSSMDTTKSVLKQRKYTSDTSYKQLVRSSSLGKKESYFTRVRHTPSPLMTKSEAKKSSKRDEVSNVIVRSGSDRRSSKISDISATSASSIVSLKYGLQFDNILQSTGLVRRFMKSQNGEQREAHHQSPSKHVVKNGSTRTVRSDYSKNRYKVSPPFQKSKSPLTDSRGRTTPEYSRKSVSPTEYDVEIQEITMTDHRMERRKSRESSSPEQSKNRVDSPNVSSSLRKIISPKRDCGRQHDVKTKPPSRLSTSGKIARRGANIPKTTFSRRVTDQREDQNYASKYATYTIKGRKRQNVLVAEKKSPDLSDGRVNIESKSDESKDMRGFSKTTLTQHEHKSREDIGRMESLSVQELAARRFDSVAAESEHSARASPEISLRTMDMQTKASAEKLKARPTMDSYRKVTSVTTSGSTLRSPTAKGSKVGNVARRGDLKTIPSKVIRSSRRITKTYRSSSENKPGSTQRRSPACKRQLFEADSKKVQKERTDWSLTKTRKRENYSYTNVRSRGGEATSKVKSLGELDVAKRSRSSKEAPTISVKPLRSIEDIRKSIGCHDERSALTAAKRSRSAIANWRSSTSRESGDARRSIFANGAARRASQPARLTKVQSCVSRIAKSPSPDASARKQHETNTRPTRGSIPSSPSKSPDMHVAPRRGSTESKNQDAKSARRLVVAKAAESIESKTTTEATDAADDVVQRNDSPHESSAKKSDAFVIDPDDRPKENDTTPPKKVTPMRRSSNDKNQTTSSAVGRPTSSASSNFSNAGTTQSQASGTKSRMATRAKTSVSSGSPTKGPSSPRNTNSADNLIACNICGRNFAQDRIGLHEQICTKTTNKKKRKPFDTMKFRLRGTELEPFAKKTLTKKQEQAKKPQPKSDWRRKHEEFIEAIRSAKMVQAHLAAGGNLKDLPPPPPSDTSDYIQCPHCSRRFNQAAAKRHIPLCENMLHNKPAHARATRSRR